MDVNFLMGIIGVLGTLILGYLGINYTLKYRSKIKLNYFENDCFSLFQTVVKNFNTIEIKYNKEAINQNLILLKGTFLNSGNIDLDKSNVHVPLSLHIPDNFKVLEAKVIDASNDLIVTNTITSNSITFIWDLLKKEEYFTFDVLIEHMGELNSTGKEIIKEELNLESNRYIERELSNNITFKHRITNLSKIDKDSFPTKPMSKVAMVFFILYMLFLIGGPAYFGFWQLIKPQYEIQYFKTEKGIMLPVNLVAENNNIAKLKYVDGKTIEENTLDSLFLKYNLKPFLKRTPVKKIDLISGGLMSLAMLLIFITLLVTYIKRRRLSKITNQIKNSQRDRFGSFLFRRMIEDV